MKRNKVLKIIGIVLASLLALLVLAGGCVFLYFRQLMNNLPETLPDATEDAAQVTLTDADLEKLLSGEITLDDLTAAAGSDSTTEADASASAPQQDAADTDAAAGEEPSASGGASSGGNAAGASGKTETGSNAGHTGDAAHSGTTASSGGTGVSSGQHTTSGKTEAAYEAEVKALIRQLYSVKARAESELNSCVAGAKAEYKALPESQQTQARKVSIALSRSSKLYAMQASYDKEVEGIVNQMRSVLKANGQSTDLADQAMASYKAQKNATYSSLVAKLYS